MPAYKDENKKSNPWYCKFTYTDWEGKKHQKLKRGFATKREATEWEINFKSSQKFDNKTTMETIAKEFLEEIALRREESTVVQYELAFKNHINKEFGEMPIAAITEKHYALWQNKLLQSGLAPSYINHLDSAFRTVFKFGAKRCKIHEMPFDGREKVGSTQEHRTEYWTHEEFHKFLSVIDIPMYHLAFQLLFFCGLRKGELIALNAGDVVIDTVKQVGVIHITKNLQRTRHSNKISKPKTKTSTRNVSIPKRLFQEIEDYKSTIYDCNDETRLFPISLMTLNGRLKKYAEKAKVKPIHVHDLRRSHATVLLNNDIPIRQISDRLGHSNTRITEQIYTELYPEKQQALVDILDSL